MSNLSGALSIAVGALQAEQGALTATTNNVANANTPGYSRQRPVLIESDPIVLGSLTFGSGVTLQKLESLRDPILQLRIQQETQQQGQLDAFVSALQQTQVSFTSSSNDLGTQITNFFNSLDQLSTAPTDSSLRQGVLIAAGNLASTFNTTADNLIQQRSSLDLNVTQAVGQVNTLTGEIAKLNGQISDLQNANHDASAFIDQRDVLIGQLSGLVDVATIKSDNGVTLTTSNGTALVAGNQSFTLSTQTDPSGLQHIFSKGADITSKLTSGSLAGLIQARDQTIPGLLSNLDSLASGLAKALNTVQSGGFDLNGAAGGDLFVAPSASGQGYAASIAVAISDPALLAANSDGSAGSNGNAVLLAGVRNQAVVAGQTATEFYSNLVFGVGSDISNGSAELSASQLALQQLQDQRGSISGVSLDEEAANMVRYQNAYDAAARVVTTVNQMLETVINMGTLA
ncbi:MAG TPA: flagellar hook-associated protein FlgK [Terriglobales bacterium]|jgi:flagellar hook-associated protein 1 FlgK|nr:flagellar hook-associated protein FlgK [Terriglobales bacterium]